MGWTYSTAWRSATGMRDEMRRMLTDAGHTIKGDALTAYGRHYFAAVQGKGDGQTTMVTALLEKGGADHGWGYKDMDESSGPYMVDCPVRLLDLCDPPPNEWAREWREKVRAAALARTARRALAKTLKLDDTVLLREGVKPRGPFRIISLHPLRGVTGYVTYRLKASDVLSVNPPDTTVLDTAPTLVMKRGA